MFSSSAIEEPHGPKHSASLWIPPSSVEATGCPYSQAVLIQTWHGLESGSPAITSTQQRVVSDGKPMHSSQEHGHVHVHVACVRGVRIRSVHGCRVLGDARHHHSV